MIKPKITIITPAYNMGTSIKTAILSVANQTYKNVEHLIMDGKSNDNTVMIVRKYQKTLKHLHLRSEKDSGVYDAMNKGLDMCKGDWIYFMGADDEFYNKNVLKDIFDLGLFLDEQVLYGNVVIKGDNFWASNGSVYDGPFDLEKLFKRNICHQSIFYPRSVIERVGYFSQKYEITADWDFNIRCYSKYKFTYVDKIIAYFKTGGKSSTGGDRSFNVDFPENMIRYFNLDPDDHLYYDFNSPFYFPISRYREEKHQQTIGNLKEELTRLQDQLSEIHANNHEELNRLHAKHEETVHTFKNEFTEKEKLIRDEFSGTLLKILAGHAETINSLEKEHGVQLETQRKEFEEKIHSIENRISTINKMIIKKDEELNHLATEKKDGDKNIIKLEKELEANKSLLMLQEKEFHDRIASFTRQGEILAQIIADNDQQITVVTKSKEQETNRLNEIISNRDKQIDSIHRSYTWRIGKILLAPFIFIFHRKK